MASLSTSAVRASGVGGGLLIAVLAYTPAGFSDQRRLWAAAATLVLGLVVGEALLGLRSEVSVPGAIPAVLLVALLAMYLCVPETDQFVLAGLVPFALLVAETLRREHVGMEWYVVAAGGVAWAGIFGSAGRQSALIGALFSWWPLLLPWLASCLFGARGRSAWIGPMLLGSVAALVFARTGGVDDSTSSAAAAVCIIAAVSLASAWLVVRRTAVSPGTSH